VNRLQRNWMKKTKCEGGSDGIENPSRTGEPHGKAVLRIKPALFQINCSFRRIETSDSQCLGCGTRFPDRCPLQPRNGLALRILRNTTRLVIGTITLI
jgi:hypothetical protein